MSPSFSNSSSSSLILSAPQAGSVRGPHLSVGEEGGRSPDQGGVGSAVARRECGKKVGDAPPHLHTYALPNCPQVLFRFAHTDPKNYLDVSKFMQMSAAVEIGITKVWEGSGAGYMQLCWRTSFLPHLFSSTHPHMARAPPMLSLMLRHAPLHYHHQIFHKIFEKGCVKPDGSRGLFVDVGGNFGWYTVVNRPLRRCEQAYY